MKNKKGITLIALVITVIILIILAGVAIYLALGNNGILNKAEQAKNETTKQTATEKMNLKITNMQIEKYAEEQRMPTLQEFADGLCEDEEIQYVQLQSKKVGSLSKIEVGEAESIFTKLKEYPYEFEINSSLQLASIDGIQVATTGGNSNNIQPTEIKFDTYICNKKNTTGIYDMETSMTGFTRTTDEDNKISEYLSYSDTNGYTVLKSGWYFIRIKADLSSISGATDLYMYFYINDNRIDFGRAWAAGGDVDCISDSFSIYLKQDDKIYFGALAHGDTAKNRNATGYINPMF